MSQSVHRPRVAAGLVVALVLAVLGVLSTSAPSEAGSGPNLIANGSFEDPFVESPTSYEPGSPGILDWTIGGETVQVTPAESFGVLPQDGDQALVLNGAGGVENPGSISQRVGGTVQGVTYVARFWYASGGEGTGALDVRFGDATVSVQTDTSQWQQGSVTFGVGDGGPGLAFVATQGRVRVDEVSVVIAEPTNLLTNGSFEVPTRTGVYDPTTRPGIPAWTVSDLGGTGGVETVDAGIRALDGRRVLDLYGTGPGQVRTTIATTEPGDYIARFGYALAPSHAGEPIGFSFSLDDTPQTNDNVFSTEASRTPDPEPPGNDPHAGWTYIDTSFTSTGGPITLTLTADFNDYTSADGVWIDDVTIERVAASALTASLSVSSPGEGTTPPGASQVPVSAVPITAIPESAQDLIASAPLRRISPSSAPLRRIPLSTIPLRRISLASAPFAAITLNQLPLTATRADGTQLTWDDVLATTPYRGSPLQNVTLLQVLDADAVTPNPALARISLESVDLSSSPLRRISLPSALLGDVQLGELIAVGPTSTAFTDVCAGSNCASLGVTATSPVLAADLARLPLRRIPLRRIPLSSISTQALPLRSIPLRRIPLSAIPIRDTPLRAIPLSPDGYDVQRAPGVRDLTLAQLATTSRLRTSLVGTYPDSTPLRLVLAGDLATFTLGDLGPFTTPGLATLTIDDLATYAGSGVSLGAVLASLTDPADVPWEDITLADLSLQSLSASPLLRYDGQVAVTGSGADREVEISLTLPAGYVFESGGPADSANLSEPSFEDLPGGATQVTWRAFGLQPGAPSSVLSLQAFVHPGLSISGNPDMVTLAASADPVQPTEGNSDPSPADRAPLAAGATAAVTVVDTESHVFEQAPTLATDTLAVGHSLTPGRPTYYKVPVPPAGTRVSVLLSNLPVDADLVVYGPGTLTEPSSAPLRRIPLRSVPLPDPGTDASLSLPTPQVLQDDVLQDPRLPIVGSSTQRSNATEEINLLSPGGGGFYTVQVTAYNGAVSTSPWLLRVKQVTPVDTACSPRPSVAQTASASAATPSIAAGTTSLFLVNVHQLTDTYGAAKVNEMLTAVRSLAARSDVRGAVVAIDGYRPIASAYDAWNAAPCSIPAANVTARSISDLITTVKSSTPTIASVALVGGDDALPMARVPDLTSSVNERTFADSDTGPGGSDNPFTAAQKAGYLLSDDPYGTTRPIAWLDRHLYVPELAVGRLVETPDQVIGQLTQFVAAGGVVDPRTSFTAGYDFLTDGAAAVDAALGTALPKAAGTAAAVTRGQLNNDTWTRADLLNRIVPAGAAAAPSIQSVNAHFDQARALPAAGNTAADETDLVTTADLAAAPGKLNGKLLFSMGCHAGLNVPLSYSGLTGASATATADWPKQLATQRAIWVANTGYGLGDTATVALSEALMRNFAARLDGTLLAGSALAFAKQAYLGELGTYGAADEKALQQIAFYGLPMWRIGGPTSTGATAVVLPPVAPLTTVTPVAAAAAGGDAVVGLSSFAATTTPTFTRRDLAGGTSYWDVAGQSQTTAGAPIQPRTSVPVTPNPATGTTAHGTLITSLTSTDVAGVTPRYARAVIDQGANEPAQPIAGTTFPGNIVNLSTVATPAGDETRVVLIPGQFSSAAGQTAGTQRLFTSVGTRTYYATTGDYTAPTFSTLSATRTGTSTIFSTDLVTVGTQTIRRVVVLVRNGSASVWTPVELTRQGTTSRWSATATGLGAGIEWFAQAVTSQGNVGVSTNKGVYFGATTVLQTATVTAAAVTATSGSPISIPVTVSGTAGTPTGSVSVSTAAGALLGTAVLSPAGTATLTLPAGSIPIGTATLALAYVGDTAYRPATGSVTVTVSAAPVQTPSSLAVGDITIVYGKAGTAVVTVTGTTAPRPTGIVTVSAGTRVLGSAPVVASTGQATVTIPATTLDPGRQTLTARYAGDSRNAASSRNFTAQVARTTPTMRATVSPAKVVVNTTRAVVTVTVTAPDGIVPTGFVALAGADQGAQLVRLVNAQATFTLKTYPKVAKYAVGFLYSGDTFVQPAAAAVVIDVVRR